MSMKMFDNPFDDIEDAIFDNLDDICWECGHEWGSHKCNIYHDQRQIEYDHSCESCKFFTVEGDASVGMADFAYCEAFDSIDEDLFPCFPFNNSCTMKQRKGK